ncbi:MAG: DUF2339 domain-containing protein [Rickettsiales bacterium]|nr:DUF2339 domain-containing protein [Rickettsiales bacterium]
MQAIIFWGGLALLLIGIFYVLIPVILWKQRKHIKHLENEITFLHHQIKHISNKLDSDQQPNVTDDISHELHEQNEPKEPEIETTPINEPSYDAKPSPALTTSYSIEHEIIPDTINEDETSDYTPCLSETFDDTKPTEPIIEPPQKKEKITFEQQFGARLPVWIGGIALALAGFFLVKYSIEHNLITPEIRVFMGVIFGIGLIYVSQKIIAKETIANGTRIAQSLAGSGIAVLYLSSYAATKLYHFVPTFVGFVSMGMITVTALILCLRYGAPIGLLGMAGGFLTPALLSTGDGNAMTLFIYLYFTASGLLIVVKKTKLWWLSIPTILLSLGWVIVWLFSNRYTPEDSIWLILFLVGVSATIIINSKDQFASDRTTGMKYNGMFKFTSILNYIGLGGTLVMMGLIAGKSGFGVMELLVSLALE